MIVLFISSTYWESVTFALQVLLMCVYLSALFIACTYGLHRYWLVWLHRHHSRIDTRQPMLFSDLPHVTVQLPMYNEGQIACRVIEAACKLNYPKNRLHIQVLDDSTDASKQIVAQCVKAMQNMGHDIVLLHRNIRAGYKAGALKAGLDQTENDFIAIFDADFIPPPDFLHKTIHHFTDSNVGMVQASWDHLNLQDSLLTRCQAVYLDSHFHIEHTARHHSDKWFNFNGTAGIWRRNTIESAGGWQHDTLTEDVDLSYRAQLDGWQFIYLPTLACPAELPQTMRAFKTQQHRWVKGTMQTCLKLLPRILRSNASFGHKMEAWFHLTSPVVYPCVMLIVLLMLPVIWMSLGPFERGSFAGMMMGMSILMLATASGCVYYLAGQKARGHNWLQMLWLLPAIVALGIGLCLNNTRAVFEAIFGYQTPFLRTPKNNSPLSERRTDTHNKFTLNHLVACLEWLVATYLIGCIALASTPGPQRWALPFLILFAAGILYVRLSNLPISSRLRTFAWHYPRIQSQQALSSE